MLPTAWPKKISDYGNSTLDSNTTQRTHRGVAMSTFWRTFHHDGKISPAWWGWGCTPSPFHTIYHHELIYGVRSRWEGRYISPISPLSLYVLCGKHLQNFQVSQCFYHSLLCISSMRISFSNHSNSYHALVRVWSCGVVGRGAVVGPCLPLAVAVWALLGGQAVGSCTCNKGMTN